MDITFEFDIGERVDHKLGFSATVTHLSVNRSGEPGYWLEYLDAQGVVRDVYAPESELTAT